MWLTPTGCFLPPPAGPEQYPWDHTHGYHAVLGVTRASGITFASFAGPGSCLAGTYALANHEAAPDAAHPVFMAATNLQSVAAAGLVLQREPDPEWRNEADCGMATFNRSDGRSILLNCAGGGTGTAMVLCSTC
jgi:hypothetical protein